MATYLILNLVFLAVVAVLLRIRPRRPGRAWTLMIVALLLLTAVFDSLLIAAGIVAYDESKILGLRLGLAPVEDFFYAILAAVMVPTLWNKWEES